MRPQSAVPSAGAGPLPSRIVVASGNAKKRLELERLLAGASLEVRSLADYPAVTESPEDGSTFLENAVQKARHYAAATGEWCVADDSGIEVDALGGRPGIHSARYAGVGASDEANRRELLRALESVPAERRGARFHCALVLARPDGAIEFQTEATTEGRVLDAPRGSGGFGYDPLFLSLDLGRGFAEVSAEEKDRVSHRGRALRRFLDHLRSRTAAP